MRCDPFPNYSCNESLSFLGELLGDFLMSWTKLLRSNHPTAEATPETIAPQDQSQQSTPIHTGKAFQFMP